MNNKGFRIGDKVTCFLWGKGVVTEIFSSVRIFPVKVNFGSPLERTSYTIDGRHTIGSRPTLFHGHNVTFEVHGEEVPKRTVTRYVNILQDIHNGRMFVYPVFYNSISEAREKSIKESCGCRLIAEATPVEIPEDKV